MKVPLGLSLLKDVSNPEAFLSSRCRLLSSPSTPHEQKKQQDLLIEPASRHIGLAVNEHGTSQYRVRIRWLIYSREKSFYLSYGKHWTRRLQSVRTRPAKGNTHTGLSFISSRISE